MVKYEDDYKISYDSSGNMVKTMSDGKQFTVSPNDSLGRYVAPSSNTTNNSGTSGNSGTYKPASTGNSQYSSSPDYFNQAKDLYSSTELGANWEEMLQIYNDRQAKIAADPSLEKYLNQEGINDKMLAYIKYGQSQANNNAQIQNLQAQIDAMPNMDEIMAALQERPQYQQIYSPERTELINKILSRDDFSYNAMNDPLFQQYAATYAREGDRAMRETMAEAAAQAGGMNSYAMTAAQQANNYYASQTADMIPQLYNMAYEMYLQDKANLVENLGLLQSMDNNEYSRYRDTMSDWASDRNFLYDMYRDQMGDYWTDKEFNYNAAQDQLANDRWQMQWDYTVGQDALNREWQERIYGDELGLSKKESAYNTVIKLLDAGVMPITEQLVAAGITESEAKAYLAERAKVLNGSTGSGGGSGTRRTGGGGGDGLDAAAGKLVDSWTPSVDEYYAQYGVNSGRNASAAELYLPSALAHLQPLKQYGVSDADLRKFAEDMVSDYVKNGIYKTNK